MRKKQGEKKHEEQATDVQPSAKRSRSARRKSSMRARRRETRAAQARGSGGCAPNAAAVAGTQGMPMKRSSVRDVAPATRAANTSTEESDSSDEEDIAAVTPGTRCAGMSGLHFLTWARGSASSLLPGESLDDRVPRPGDVLCFRLVELCRSGCVVVRVTSENAY